MAKWFRKRLKEPGGTEKRLRARVADSTSDPDCIALTGLTCCRSGWESRLASLKLGRGPTRPARRRHWRASASGYRRRPCCSPTLPGPSEAVTPVPVFFRLHDRPGRLSSPPESFSWRYQPKYAFSWSQLSADERRRP